MTMHACERARARYLNDRVRCKMSTVAPNLNGLTQCPVECATLRCTCSQVRFPTRHRHPPSLCFSTLQHWLCKAVWCVVIVRPCPVRDARHKLHTR